MSRGNLRAGRLFSKLFNSTRRDALLARAVHAGRNADSRVEPLEPRWLLANDLAGYVWNDANANGMRDPSLIRHARPDVVFVIDASTPTTALAQGTPVGDVNGDKKDDTILDAEIKAFMSLNQDLIRRGLGDVARVSVVKMSTGATVLDMDPVTPGVQIWTTPLADKDAARGLDIDQVMQSLRSAGSRDYRQALQVTNSVFTQLGTGLGQGHMIFLAAGQPDTVTYDSEVRTLQDRGAILQAFGLGTAPQLATLQIIDSNATVFLDFDTLDRAFAGPDGTIVPFTETGLSGWRVFVDLNSNGQLDGGEPSAVTDANGNYSITNLAAGTFPVVQLSPGGSWRVTSPLNGQISVTITDKGTARANFGNTDQPGGTISGYKWHDEDHNGIRNSNFLIGDNPDVVYVIDVSGSTAYSWGGSRVGDINRDGTSDTVLDGELAGFLELNKHMPTTARVSIVVFADFGANMDMNPGLGGIQLATTPYADNNRNGRPDVEDILRSIREGQNNTGGGTDYEPALQKVIYTLTALGTLPGNGNMIFLSDGAPFYYNYDDEVDILRTQYQASVRAFGAGAYTFLYELQLIDPDAQAFNTTQELTSYFGNLGEFTEVGLSGWSIYIDLNNNGQADLDEPVTVTDVDGNYAFSNVAPGMYAVAEIPQQGWQATSPVGGRKIVQVAPGQVVEAHFGNAVPVRMSISDISVTEGNSLIRTARLTVTLDSPTTMPVTVQYTTSDGSATRANNDYVALSGTLLLPVGETVGTIEVQINGDTVREPNESFFINLVNPSGAELTDDRGEVTILNDDYAVLYEFTSPGFTFYENGGAVAVYVSRTGDLEFSSGIRYATRDGSAAAGQDYADSTGVLQFEPGEASKAIVVPLFNDSLVEGRETFTVTLGPVEGGGAIGAQSATLVTIWDDDLPAVSLRDTQVIEGNSGITTLRLNVDLSAPAPQPVTLRFDTLFDNGVGSSNPATAGIDYTPLTGRMLTIPVGSSSATVDIDILTDIAFESNETFLVNVSSPVNATIADAQAVATIIDDEVPSVRVADVVLKEGTGGLSTLTFTISLSDTFVRPVSVRYDTANASAMAGFDYIATSGVAVFDPGTKDFTVDVQVIGDAEFELTESFYLNLSNPQDALLADPQALGTITDDEISAVSVADMNVSEGNGGLKNALFTLSISPPSPIAISLRYATSDGTAIANNDYVPSSGLLSIGAGETTVTIAVPVIGDLTLENSETFFLNLTPETNCYLADGQGQATIVNDDLPSLAIADVGVPEGNSGSKAYQATVSLSGPSLQPVTVAYAFGGGDAEAGVDYTGADGLLTFAPGEVTQTISFTVLGDTAYEPNEAIVITLSNPTEAVLADATGLATILNDELTTLSIADLASAEGNAGATPFAFVLTFSQVPTSPVTVEYVTTDGSAVAGSDYAATAGVLTIPAGQSTATITVPVVGDTAAEPDETFILSLLNISGAILADNTATGTIVNDELPAISVADVVSMEGNAGVRNYVFTVSLSQVGAQDITVRYATNDDTAVAGEDYTSASGVLTIPAGQSSATVIVQVFGDTRLEPDEAFSLDLADATNATIADGQAFGRLLNDELPTLSVSDASRIEGIVGSGPVIFTVTLAVPSSRDVTIQYATGDLTAQAGADYIAASGVLTIPAGQTTATVSVTVLGDDIVEDSEVFAVNLLSATNAAIADGQGLGTIITDEAPTLSIADLTLVEDGGGVGAVRVSLSFAALEAVTVSYGTSDGTATAGADYLPASGSLVFEPGEVVKTIPMGGKILDDTLNEGSEGFLVSLTGATGARIGDSRAVVTIADNDPLPALSISDVSVVEGNSGVRMANFILSLSAASGQAVSVHATTSDDTATGGIDYEATSSAIIFSPGQVTKTFAVPVFGGITDEPDETFSVILANVVNATVADGQAVGVIVNDEPLPTLTISNASRTEGDGGVSLMSFAVRLSRATGRTASVDYATTDGTARAGYDYTPVSGTLRFAPGVTVRTITVPVRGDSAIEGNETFFLNLADPSAATLRNTRATGTIVDNDAAPDIAATLTSPRTELTDDQETPVVFGTVARGAAGPRKTFLVRNVGTRPLRVSSLRLPTGFTLVNPLATTIAAGASDTFVVRMLTTRAGVRSGKIVIYSNDPDESPFEIPVIGEVVNRAAGAAIAAPADSSTPRRAFAGLFASGRSVKRPESLFGEVAVV